MTDQLQWKDHSHDWPNSESSRFVRSGRLNWHVQIAGEGPVILLVHGTGASTHSWRSLFSPLKKSFTVVAVDLPGHAFTSGQTDQQLTLPGMSAALAALLRELDIEPDYAAGHSAGAAVLVNMGLDQQLSAKRIVSINGALLPFRGMAGAIFPTLAKLLYLNPLAPRLFAWKADDKRSVARLLAGMGSELDDRGIDLYARLFRSVGHVRATTRMMALWDLDTLAQRLPELAIPLHLVASSNDQAVPVETAFEVHKRLKHAKLLVVKGLGHLAHEEDPDHFVKLLCSIAGEGAAASAVCYVDTIGS